MLTTEDGCPGKSWVALCTLHPSFFLSLHHPAGSWLPEGTSLEERAHLVIFHRPRTGNSKQVFQVGGRDTVCLSGKLETGAGTVVSTHAECGRVPGAGQALWMQRLCRRLLVSGCSHERPCTRAGVPPPPLFGPSSILFLSSIPLQWLELWLWFWILAMNATAQGLGSSEPY